MLFVGPEAWHVRLRDFFAMTYASAWHLFQFTSLSIPVFFSDDKPIPQANTAILQGQEAEAPAVREALRGGFEYCFENHWLHFSWKTPEEQLPQIPGFSQEQGVFGWPVWRLNAPVRLAGLELRHRLEINDSRANPQSKLRLDVPIPYFGFYAAFGGDGKNSYQVLKKHLTTILGPPVGGWEREDQLHSEWSLEGLKMACLWTNPQQINRISREFDEYATLSIWNDIRYPEWLTDDYTQALRLSGEGFFMAFFEPKLLQVMDNYRTSSLVRLTPELIAEALEQSGKTLAVWLDLPNNRIGFARRELALAIPVSELKQLNFSTMDCDRHNEDRLYAVFNSGEEMQLLYAAEGALQALKQWFASFPELPVVDLGFQP